MVAAKIAAVVIQPKTLMARPFTRSPIMAGLLVINIISSISGGVENPWTDAGDDERFHWIKAQKIDCGAEHGENGNGQVERFRLGGPFGKAVLPSDGLARS